MKVLLSAYACQPGSGSEPGAGWGMVAIAAQTHEVWVLTRANNRAAIEATGLGADHRRVHLVYLDLGPVARALKRLPFGTQLYYIAWQLRSRRTIRGLHAEHRFDLVHHATLAADWMPAGVLGLAGARSVWGPVGGVTGVPRPLWRWLGWRGVLREGLREGVTRLLRRWFGRRAARAADVVIAQNHDVATAFRPWATDIVTLPNVVAEPPDVAPEPRAEVGGIRHAVFVGQLKPLKGLRLAVAALSEKEAENWHLLVLGSGPERRPVERMARRLGVADRVTFRGMVPRHEVLRELSRADALLAPSIHEAAGFAVAEAIAYGCPVVCLDRGGPAVTVDAERGTKVPVGPDLPRRLARALAGTGERRSPSDRWSSRRLEVELSRVYEQAAHAREVG